MIGCSWAPLRALLAALWTALGTTGATLGTSLAAPGAHFGIPGTSFWNLLCIFLKCPWKDTETLISLAVFQLFLKVFGDAGGPKWLQNRSRIASGGRLVPLGGSWASLGAQRAQNNSEKIRFGRQFERKPSVSKGPRGSAIRKITKKYRAPRSRHK